MEPFIALENIHFLPVLRNRLSFAALFRRALGRLNAHTKWSEEDLICVSLPPILAAPLKEALHDLPRVSQFWLETADGTAREIFTVTPCDAFVEAVRTANENAHSIKFIDIGILPGNLVRHPCQRDPNWPDDSFVDVVGIDRYLEVVAPYLAQPPMRFEPLDTWREARIVASLRDLHPHWRRILFVCDMPLIRRVVAALAAVPAAIVSTAEFGTAGRVRRIENLKIVALLEYLDDYPRLVERFHDSRNECFEEFDKRTMLLDEIGEFLRGTRDITISTRQIEKFAAYINNVAVAERRRVPSAAALFQCTLGIFGRAIAERLHCHLSGYFNHIAVERVRPRRGTEGTTFRYSVDVQADEHGLVSRSCSPFPPQFDVLPPSHGLGRDRNARDDAELTWPPEQIFLKSMQTRLRNVVVAPRKTRKVRRYEGSIEAGIDMRRTLRHLASGLPHLYVKVYEREPELKNVELEPVLWLLSNEYDTDQFYTASRHFGISTNEVSGLRRGESFFIAQHDLLRLATADEVRLYRDDRSTLELWGFRRLAFLSFGDQFETEDEARAAYGTLFAARIPNHQEYEHPGYDGSHGCIHRDFAALVDDHSWIEIAALTAAKYASEAVTVVAPAGVVLPPSILRHPICAQKRFIYVPLETFSRLERDKLRTHYRLMGGRKGTSGGKTRDFEKIMQRFWT